MEISFDLTLSSSCTGTSCHILRIGHANSQERVPLIEILDGTNAIRMAYSDAQHSNSGHSIDHADVKAAVVDGQKHHYYFKFHPTQRIFELDNVRYLDESDGPYDTSSYDGQTYPMYAVDDIEFGQSLVDAVIENICVISRDLVELPTVTTTTAPTNNPTTTTTDAPITLSPSTTSVPPSTTEQECQYELVPQVLNWWTAEAYCQSQFEDNGHLMSIHNLKEAKLAHKLCDTEAINPGLGALPILQNDTNCCCWIGLNDYVTEGVFLWSDDSENDYENWYGDGREGELIADEEDCAVVTDWTNKWFDRSCLSSSHIGGFICQYGCDKAPKTTTTGLPTTTETIAPTDDVITTQETTAIDTTATPQTTQEVVDTTAVPPDTTDTPQTTVEDVITTRSDVPQTTAEVESTTTTDVPGTTVEDIVTTGVTPTDVPETTAKDIATTLEPDTTGVEPTDTTISAPDTTVIETTGEVIPSTTESVPVTTDSAIETTVVSDLPITPEPETTVTDVETTTEDIATTQEPETTAVQTTEEGTDAPQTTSEIDATTTQGIEPDTTVIETTEEVIPSTTTDVPGTTAEDIVTTGVTPTDVPETTTEDIATTLEPDTTGVEPTDTTISAPDTTVIETTGEVTPSTTEHIPVTTDSVIETTVVSDLPITPEPETTVTDVETTLEVTSPETTQVIVDPTPEVTEEEITTSEAITISTTMQQPSTSPTISITSTTGPVISTTVDDITTTQEVEITTTTSPVITTTEFGTTVPCDGDVDFVILFDNSCGLETSDCRNMLEGIGELVMEILDDGSNATRVQTIQFNEDHTTDVIVSLDSAYQQNRAMYFDFLLNNGECEGGGGDQTGYLKPAIMQSVAAMDQTDNRLDKLIIVSACKDMAIIGKRRLLESGIQCDLLRTQLNMRDIDTYVVNLVKAGGTVDSQMDQFDAREYLSCLTNSDVDRICVGESTEGVNNGEILDLSNNCLLPKVCDDP
eukprot:418256_1